MGRTQIDTARKTYSRYVEFAIFISQCNCQTKGFYYNFTVMQTESKYYTVNHKKPWHFIFDYNFG